MNDGEKIGWQELALDVLIWLASALVFLFLFVGCASTPQLKTYKACVTLEQVGVTESMVPVIGPLDWVKLDWCYNYEDLRKGMVVVYRTPEGRRIIHRLAFETADGNWIAKGDNNRVVDNIEVTEENFESVLVSWGRGIEKNDVFPVR